MIIVPLPNYIVVGSGGAEPLSSLGADHHL
jgi:hypothetical protein